MDAYFDYIVRIDGVEMTEDCNLEWITQLAKTKMQLEEPIVLEVYNRRYDDFRQVSIFPNADWGGDGLLGTLMGHFFV